MRLTDWILVLIIVAGVWANVYLSLDAAAGNEAAAATSVPALRIQVKALADQVEALTEIVEAMTR
jgi:hypothetical protein